jgi:hypothetical protein
MSRTINLTLNWKPTPIVRSSINVSTYCKITVRVRVRIRVKARVRGRVRVKTRGRIRVEARVGIRGIHATLNREPTPIISHRGSDSPPLFKLTPTLCADPFFYYL